MSQYLFVYGTLMRGEEREGIVAHLPAKPAIARGHLWRAPAGYPALLIDSQGLPIRGELLAVEQPSIFMVLDLYEGVAEGLYNREIIDVQTENGSTQAWAYVMTRQQLRRAGCQLLKTMDWRTVSPKL